ncbi:MAG TPA: helix-turn-helix domain-containing protein, partial [Actinotalea sp.]|nr:helix-turn-helix domain-containing protein [Actinotalea sp.]
MTDPRALRAMAHPLRLDLIELLGTEGPATAAECARRLGSTQAGCSYHLRQLAAYGFVEQAESRGDARERPWQLTDLEQSWSGTGKAAEELERVFVQREADRILAWQAATQPEHWRD